MKRTFTYTAADGHVSKRASESKEYTHVVLFGAEGEERAVSWHTSRDHADKKAASYLTCAGRESFKDKRITVAAVDGPMRNAASIKTGAIFHPAARQLTRMLLGR